MRRILPCLLALMLLMSCSPQPSEQTVSSSRWIKVYYENTEDTSLIEADTYEIDAESGLTSSVRSALEFMQIQPPQTNLKPALPENVTVQALRFENEIMHIDFSSEYQELSGLDKTVCEACIAMTLSNFWNIKKVVISANGVSCGVPLEVRNYATKTPEIIKGEQEISVYLKDPLSGELAVSQLTVECSGDELPEYAAANALTHGISGSRLVSPLPAGCILQSVSCRSGVCYVSFSKELLTCSDDKQAIKLVQAIVCTLTSVDYIDAVQILVDGAEIEGFKTIDLRREYSEENFDA